MALARDFFGSNKTFGAGGIPNVNDLRVHQSDSEIISCWALSEAELQEIQRTGCVWLSIMGRGMPPVFISGHPLMFMQSQGKQIPYDPNYKEPNDKL